VKESVIILIPVYNDLASLETLIHNLELALATEPRKKYSLLIVNDGSTQPVKVKPTKLFKIHLLHLHRNNGHQKAIAIGLAHIHHHLPCDHVAIMDGDGEDKPEDVITLLHTADVHTGQIVCARRRSRQEGMQFRLFYVFYKRLFRWLTGKKISFGNFMILPKDKVDKLVYYSEIWSHLSAAIIKSRLEYTAIPVHRGKRYAGTSKMNFTSLVLHGLGAIAVFLEQAVSRLLILSSVLIGVSVVAILVIFGTIMSSMLIVLLQGFLLSLFTIFLFLSSQSQRKFIPAHHYKDYTASTETIAHE
jgi:glycosyltransferase involved in cell wall biosynthesis